MTNLTEEPAGKKEGHKLPNGFCKEKAAAALNSLIQYNVKQKSDSLFLDEALRILMDISVVKTPNGSKHFYNIVLPSSPYPIESMDIILVVRDKKDEDPEITVGTVQDELKALNMQSELNLRQILTLKQLKDDYSTYEAKRALAKSVDIIIAEDQVFKCLPPILGREFYKKKKLPLSIPGREFKKFNLADQILYALKKTVMNISTKGQTSTVVVGHDNLSVEQLSENVSKICQWIRMKYPGGWKNIARLALHTGKGPQLDIYVSTGPVNLIYKIPTTTVVRQEEFDEDEISTQPGRRVKVFAEGGIEVKLDDLSDEDDKEIIAHLRAPINRVKPKPKPEVGEEAPTEISSSVVKTKENVEDDFIEKMNKKRDYEAEQEELSKSKAKGKKAKTVESPKKLNKANQRLPTFPADKKKRKGKKVKA